MNAKRSTFGLKVTCPLVTNSDTRNPSKVEQKSSKSWAKVEQKSSKSRLGKIRPTHISVKYPNFVTNVRNVRWRIFSSLRFWSIARENWIYFIWGVKGYYCTASFFRSFLLHRVFNMQIHVLKTNYKYKVKNDFKIQYV